MRMLLIGVVSFLAVVLDGAVRTAQAQPYCAMYTDGSQNCGIPTLQSCQYSVASAGGFCQVDQTSQLPPNLIQRWRAEQSGQDPQSMAPPSADTQPGGLNWMPPPPGQ